MKIVIDIDEELYNYIQTEEYDEHLSKRFDYQIRFAVKDGTPLTNVLNMISKEVDALKNYSYLFTDMIFNEVHKVIDKYKR